MDNSSWPRLLNAKIVQRMNPKLEPDGLVKSLIANVSGHGLCVLDSCNALHRGSTMMFAGFEPREAFELSATSSDILRVLDDKLTGDRPCIFTLSYDFGRKLQGISDKSSTNEPDIFIASFDGLIAFDYSARKTFTIGTCPELLTEVLRWSFREVESVNPRSTVSSNLTKSQYLSAIDDIKEHIRRGDTYQTNLTQRIQVEMRGDPTPAGVFDRLRQRNPAPFSAYIERPGSTVISASPERFFRISGRNIEVSPIKGTAFRGRTPSEDAALRHELLTSEKNIAENAMIVDLMRNDLGRVCEYGSVVVRDLYDLQTLPTLFHLVSTVGGQLRDDARPSDILRALFPCGSITGAPKIRTMQIIEAVEPHPRGLSMGSIGVYIPQGFGRTPVLDLSVAIRTMVIRDGIATFNVGGGIVIDSEPEAEYDESLLKAKAPLDALGASLDAADEWEQFKASAV